ncbi:hypothetical protein TgHK011_001433 [Trichoderma gracile]|nr:hypothetical protein TgHK011_001433 [Trichoderma gracile]
MASSFERQSRMRPPIFSPLADAQIVSSDRFTSGSPPRGALVPNLMPATVMSRRARSAGTQHRVVHLD